MENFLGNFGEMEGGGEVVLHTHEFVSMNPASDGFHETIEFRMQPTWLGRLLGMRPFLRRYYGNCTVWFLTTPWGRCDTFTEGWLSDIWERERWKRTGVESKP